jgi:hypothetical protein
VLTVSTGHNRHGKPLIYVEKHIGLLLLLMERVVAMIRSCFSALVFALLLCNVFPVEQIGWAVEGISDSTGDAGHEQTGDFRDIRAATESETDPLQETPDDCVAYEVGVLDCGSSRSQILTKEVPPSILLVSRLLHPPTTHS